jgi:hypothetical protein
MVDYRQQVVTQLFARVRACVRSCLIVCAFEHIIAWPLSHTRVAKWPRSCCAPAPTPVHAHTHTHAHTSTQHTHARKHDFREGMWTVLMSRLRCCVKGDVVVTHWWSLITHWWATSLARARGQRRCHALVGANLLSHTCEMCLPTRRWICAQLMQMNAPCGRVAQPDMRAVQSAHPPLSRCNLLSVACDSRSIA